MIKLLTVYVNTKDAISCDIIQLYWQIEYEEYAPYYSFACSLSEISKDHQLSEEAIENLVSASTHAWLQCSSCGAFLKLRSRKDFLALFNRRESSKGSQGLLPLCGACQHNVKEEKKAAFLKKLGNHLVSTRKRMGLSQVDLADKCDKEPQSIERVENEKVNPSIYYLYEVAQGMGIPLKELLDFTVD